MKAAKYTLETDGTVPVWVVSGGHFAAPNNNPAPQDYTIIGSVVDDAPIESMTLEQLVSYLESLDITTYNPITQETKTSAQVATEWWQQYIGE